MPKKSNKIWNIANIITLSRIIIIPFIVFFILIYPAKNNLIVQNHGWNSKITINNFIIPIPYLIASFLFLIASISDFIDGWYARKYNKITNFGKFFDAIADKILVNSIIICFIYINKIPIWLGLIFIIRDFIMDVLRQYASSKNIILQASKMGKIKTAVQMVGIYLLFFIGFESFANVKIYGIYNQLSLLILYIAAFLSLYSLFEYFYKNKAKLLKSN